MFPPAACPSSLTARLLFGCALLCFAPAGFAQAPPPPAVQEDILSSNLDRSVDPSKDFFSYANGSWLARHPIPASEAGWGMGDLVREELYEQLRKISEEAAKAAAPAHSDLQKIGDFWTTSMDEAKAEAAGLTPLRKELSMIDSIRTTEEVLDASFALRPLAVEAFCSIFVGQDEKQSDLMSVHVSQGGLGLPERDFYFNPEKGTARVRQEYVAHLARLLKLLGRSAHDADAAAKGVMEFETSLAKASRKLEDLRDPEENYHKMSPADLTADHTPRIDWNRRLAAMSLRPDFVIVGQPDYLTALDRLLVKTPVPVLKDYLRVQLVSIYAPYSGKAWEDEDFEFNGKVLSGQKHQRPRWKRALDSQEIAIGMVTGKTFVQDYFPERQKRRYTDLVEVIRSAYRERISRLDWMSDATKTKAREKLDKLAVKVGYPDRWKDCSALVVGTESWCENMMNAARWQFSDMIARFGKPVDRTEWEMTPQTYNAYYQPSNNEIVLPAAIFTVPGARDEDLDDAIVYGYAAASTIGHEITHGFDDEGRMFDASGNLADWWTKEDAARFEQRSAVMVTQFNAYLPLPGLPINGMASLGENLADYGGVLLALDAFKKTEQFRGGKSIGGFTPIQRFFLGYAFAWAYQERSESLRAKLLSDVHAPAKWRVNGPLSNIPEFQEAFGIKKGSPMWRPAESHVKVW
ncbi:MAG: metalloendopeptidase [Verrucomicrobiales bacterium VVV1]|nr:MAG: metalloendopeptidase [Verrucomicrobiales bacterium VVV1]